MNFVFPPALTTEDIENSYGIDYSRFRQIIEVPKFGSSLYHLLSQYNPWLDCETMREKRAYLKPRVGEFSCAVNSGTTTTGYGGSDNRNIPNFFRNETTIDIVNLYLWPLLYSYADEVVSCVTFSDWKRLFSKTISIAFPDYEYWVSVANPGTSGRSSVFIPLSDQRRTAQILKYITPARVLYLLTTRANLWPYSAPPSSSYRETRSSSRQYGLCCVKSKIKEYNDKTEIEWLVNAGFLRTMKRVHIYFTSLHNDVFVSLNDTDSE